jgi:hypothetical protein
MQLGVSVSVMRLAARLMGLVALLVALVCFAYPVPAFAIEAVADDSAIAQEAEASTSGTTEVVVQEAGTGDSGAEAGAGSDTGDQAGQPGKSPLDVGITVEEGADGQKVYTVGDPDGRIDIVVPSEQPAAVEAEPQLPAKINPPNMNILPQPVALNAYKPDNNSYSASSMVVVGVQGGVSLLALVQILRPRVRDLLLGIAADPTVYSTAGQFIFGIPVAAWRAAVLSVGIIGPVSFLVTGDVTAGLPQTPVDWLTAPLLALSVIQVGGVFLLRRNSRRKAT